MDALRASLPAGTLSGAPKIRAMQIIDELEPVKRGPYGGAVGYLSYTGELDTCIYIRSALVKDGRVHVQAGRGHRGRLGRRLRDARDRGEGQRACSRRSAWHASRGTGRDPGARDRQLRLVHLQPRAVPGRARRRARGGPQRRAGRRTRSSSGRPTASWCRPGPARRPRPACRWTRSAASPRQGVPVLGVCLGHQALATAFGGSVVRGQPVHGKTAPVEHDGRTIFAGLESPLVAGRYHSLVVDPICPTASSAPPSPATW